MATELEKLAKEMVDVGYCNYAACLTFLQRAKALGYQEEHLKREEKEALVCPEGVGFVEYIGVLKKQIERTRALGHEEAAEAIENGSYATIPGRYRNEAAAAIRALSKGSD
jgi:hypothetical protein